MKRKLIWSVIIIALISLISVTSIMIYNQEYVRTNINDINFDRVKKLMIVAHPDDETIWGGSHLLNDKEKGDYLVVCVTCGRKKVRNNEIKKAMEMENAQVIMLGYPDKTFGKRNDWHDHKKQIEKDLNKIINMKEYDFIVTHNPKGEYGHIHHKMTSDLTTKVALNNNYENKLNYFGKYYSKNKIKKYEKTHPEHINNLKEKNKVLNVYKSQKFIHGYFGQMFKYENWLSYKDWK